MTNTLIIEDEQPAALRLAKLLKSIDQEIEIVAIIDTVESAVRWLESHSQPDLIMLDIQLGDGLSFDIFRKTKVDSYVIFTTAYDEYAIRAFELNSIDYLLKPINGSRLSQSIDKFIRFRSHNNSLDIQKLLETIENRSDKFKKRFVVSINNKIKVIETQNIAFFYSREKNSFFCTMDKKNYSLDFSLDHVEEMLSPELFFRANRQYIVQYRSITKIEVLSKSRIRIETNPPAEDEILISSARTSDFRKWLDR